MLDRLSAFEIIIPDTIVLDQLSTYNTHQISIFDWYYNLDTQG